MMVQNSKLERRLRISGVLIILGLVVELVSLKWSHPTAFLFFIMLGGLLMMLGMLLFLVSLVTTETAGRKSAAELTRASSADLSV